MERTGKTKLLNTLFLFLFLAAIVWAYFLQQGSLIAQVYTGQSGKDISIVLLSEPITIFTYSNTKKLIIIDTYEPPKPKRKPKTPPQEPSNLEKAKQALKAKNLSTQNIKYIRPAQESSARIWEEFKHIFSTWRYTPAITVPYSVSYIKTLAKDNTNIYPYEFAFLNLMVLKLEMTDFVFKLDPAAPLKTKASTPLRNAQLRGGNSPLTSQNRPLIVEVLNASGKKGAALELTQYLRSLNEKGLLNIDVLQYDNYHKTEEQTKIVNVTGRVKEVKQLSLALNLRDNELFNEENASSFCDAKIIIGKNFKMP